MLPVDAARQRPRPERVPRIAPRVEFPAGPLFCVIDGPTRGRAWSASSARIEVHHLTLKAGVRRLMAPHQYAGICVMPMLVRTSCSAVGTGQVGRHNEHPI